LGFFLRFFENRAPDLQDMLQPVQGSERCVKRLIELLRQ